SNTGRAAGVRSRRRRAWATGYRQRDGGRLHTAALPRGKVRRAHARVAPARRPGRQAARAGRSGTPMPPARQACLGPCRSLHRPETGADYNPRMAADSALPPPPRSPRPWPACLGIGLMALAARRPWTGQRAIGGGLGTLLRLALRDRRRVAARNLELCFPELDPAARQALLREHFAALGTGLFEFARAWWGPVEALRRGLVVEGLEHIEAARAGGRGVIVVSGHFTTLEVCGRLMCDHVPLAGMYRPHATPAMEWAVRRGRARYAAAMFP